MSIVKNCADHLTLNGELVLFEATSFSPRSGKTWSRRTEGDYIRLAADHGLDLTNKTFICYPFFQKSDKLLSRIFQLAFAGLSKIVPKEFPLGVKISLLRSNLNRSGIYLAICEILMAISLKIDVYLTIHEGNTLFIFKNPDLVKTDLII